MGTFGAKLRSVREERGLTLEAAAAVTGIPIDHLRALEQNESAALHDDESLALEFLRTYAGHLSVDPDLMIDDYRHERESRRLQIAVRTPWFPLSIVVAGIVLTVAILGAWSMRPKETARVPQARLEPSLVEKAAPLPVPPSTGPEPVLAVSVPPSPEPVLLSVPEYGVGTAVKKRELVGESDRFREGTQVWFWTRVVGGTQGETIDHVWLHDGVEAARMALLVGGSHWRVQSAKTLRPGSAGAWAVEARNAEGHVLARREFTVR